MTVNIQIPTVFTSIAALSYPAGVTCVDISGIPENGNMTPGVLYPNPEGLFQTTMVKAPITLGVNGAENQDLEYDISYRYLHCAPGGGLVLLGALLLSAVVNITGIIKVFVSNDTISGAIDLRLKSMSRWPIKVTDPAGNSFWGCDFTLHIIEYIS